MSAQHIKTWQDRLTQDERDEYDGVDQHTPAEIAMMAADADLRARIAELEAEREQLREAVAVYQKKYEAEASRSLALAARQPVAAEPVAWIDAQTLRLFMDPANCKTYIATHLRRGEAVRETDVALCLAAHQPATVGAAYNAADFEADYKIVQLAQAHTVHMPQGRDFNVLGFARAILAQQGAQAECLKCEGRGYYAVMDDATKQVVKGTCSVCRGSGRAAPDTARLDRLDRWLEGEAKRGGQWSSFHFDTAKPVREQFDEELDKAEAKQRTALHQEKQQKGGGE